MPRILLGVCGGIAAYKSLEFTRLALKAGHSVRVVQTEAATRFVGPASFAGITGAPVLITEWEPDPLRGVFPGDPLPEHAPLSHLALVEHADAYLIAPGHGPDDREARRRARRQPADRGRAGLPATADRRSGHEPRDVRASGHAGEPRDAARARRDRAGARARVARLARRVRGRPAARAAGAARRGRGALAVGGDLDGLRVLVSAGGTREPIDAVRYIGNRSSGRMGFALAEEAKRRGANVTVVAANVSLPGSGHRVCGRDHRRSARRGLFRALRRVRRADHGRRRRRLSAGRRARRASSRRTRRARN